MPFKSSTTFPAGEPDAQVFFHGLLLLHPESDGNHCDVGVHRLSPGHVFSLEVRVRQAEPPDPVLLRLSGLLKGSGLSIEIDPPTNEGVKKFVPTADPFDRDSNNNDARDFRWSVDLERLDPQQPALVLDDGGIHPGIIVKDGLFFAARLTDPSVVQVQLISPTNQPEAFRRVASVIGANIYLPKDSRLVLKWSEDDADQSLVLAKPEAGTSYSIYVDNSPALMTNGQPTHSEFLEYYRVIQNVPPQKQFDMTFAVQGLQPNSNDRAPCMSIIIGG